MNEQKYSTTITKCRIVYEIMLYIIHNAIIIIMSNVLLLLSNIAMPISLIVNIYGVGCDR